MTDPDCSYEFSPEHLQALWLEFQQDDEATCPETGARIEIEIAEDGERTEPLARAACERCGRRAEFRPGKLEGFQWSE